MIKILLFIIMIFLKNIAYSTDDLKPNTCNFVQIDAFLYDYSVINSEDSNQSGMNNQIFTVRPGLEMCFKTRHFNLRPNILLNPFNSSSEGALLVGKDFKIAELGLYSSINYSQKTLGNTSRFNETLENNLLIGPYLYIFPNFSDEDLYEIFFRLTYQYYLQQATVNGYTTTMSKKNGVNIMLSFLYATFLNETLAFSPSINFLYTYSVDMVGGNVGSNTFQLQFFPISFRWYLN